MTKKAYCAYVISLAITVLLACSEETKQIARQATPAPTVRPTPTVIPEPTPEPSGPPFREIRRNREIMSSEQAYRYGREMSGKAIGGCIGYFHSFVPSDEVGKSRVVVDFDEKTGSLPDFILEGVPTQIAQQFKDRQKLNFSGVIQRYDDLPVARYLLVLSDVKIFGYLD